MEDSAGHAHREVAAIKLVLGAGPASLEELAEAAVQRYREHGDTRTVTVRRPEEAERLNGLFRQAGVPLQVRVIYDGRDISG